MKRNKVIENRFIYGLDLSLASTGIVIFDSVSKEFVYIGHINTDKVKKQKATYHNALKLKYIYEELTKLKELYPPKEVIIERGFSRFNTATQVIYRVHGVANFCFHEVNQTYYPPKTVKEAIIKGDASKEVVQKCINARYNDIPFSNEDESDAFAILLTHLIKTGLVKWVKPKVKKSKGEVIIYD